MKIAFVHPHKAFLPEIQAYSSFFQSHGIQTDSIYPKQIDAIRPDLAWHFMGSDFKKKNPSGLIIHEYASASVPPTRWIKDKMKFLLNAKPDFRLFLNEFVKDQYGFRDNIPCGFRDMGINEETFRPHPEEKNKKYDFVFSGSINRSVKMDKLLDQFAGGRMKNRNILILSREYEEIRQKFQAYPNILFKGPLSQAEVAEHLRQSSYALNYSPQSEPFLHQTSTKMLEYLACRVPVITVDSPWLRGFQSNRGGHYFILSNDFSNFNWEEINSFHYTFPDLRDLTWKNQIMKSGIMTFLKNRFPEIHWPN
jgi:glycosyltransferase involved in cell wall biosynthesis